jgi:hypothetical protein
MVANKIRSLYQPPGVLSKRTGALLPCLAPPKPPLPERLIPKDPSLSVVVGTHGSPAYVHLHLEARKRFYPDIPLLVHDDNSQEEEKLRELCQRYGAEFMTTGKHQGHFEGDDACFHECLEVV